MIKKPPQEISSSDNKSESCVICLDNPATIKTASCCQKRIFCQKCYQKYSEENHLCPMCRMKMDIVSSNTMENGYINWRQQDGKIPTLLYGGCCLILVLILCILSVNYYFIHDANLKRQEAELKLQEAEKELREQIEQKQCNAIIVGTCRLQYNKYGSDYKICWADTCIQRCLDINQPTSRLDCFFIKGDVDGTLTINKREICCGFNCYHSHTKQNKYCQNEKNARIRKNNAWTRFGLMIGFLGVIGTGLILACGCVCFSGLYDLTQVDWE